MAVAKYTYVYISHTAEMMPVDGQGTESGPWAAGLEFSQRALTQWAGSGSEHGWVRGAGHGQRGRRVRRRVRGRLRDAADARVLEPALGAEPALARVPVPEGGAVQVKH